jgi:Xaa-Pro aminopeptidase
MTTANASAGTDRGVDESAARIKRLQAEMARRGVDDLIVGPSPDLRYLLGTDGHVSERMSVLIVPRAGQPAYVVPGLEAPLLARLDGLLAIHPWEETEAPAERAAQAIGPGAGRTIAVGDRLWSAFLLRLQAALPGARWIESGELMRPLRAVKDAAEIALLREAARRTDEAWDAFRLTSIAGLTEREALRRLLDLTYERGLGPNFGSCGSGPNSASPHHETGDRVIEPGDVVVFDWGGMLDGYNSDVTRTVAIGELPADYLRVYETVLAANRAALAAVRPGVSCEAIDKAARDVIDAAGYGAYFIHRVGHGLGLDIHEEPYLVAGNQLPLQAGMVFSDEPGIYLPGRFGVRIEDTVVCTEQGGELLNHAYRELTVMS